SNPRSIRVFSRNEYLQVNMRRKFNDSRLRFMVGDIRDRERLEAVMSGVDYVIHTAALKHVLTGETNPQEVVKTNVQGSTNGSVFSRGSIMAGDYVLHLDQLDYVRLANLDLAGGYYGCYMRLADHVVFSNMTFRNAANAGLYLHTSDNNLLSRCSIYSCYGGLWAGGSANTLRNCLVWSNASYGVHLDGSTTNRIENCTIVRNGRPGLDNQYQVEFQQSGYIWNSILIASGSNVQCYGNSTLSAHYSGDYNNLYATGGARIADGCVSLAAWKSASGQEQHSLSRSPHFVAGSDFHLQSSAPSGTFVMATGLWTAFPTNSPGIDNGDVDASNLQEPEPNGDLLNQGAYGNTEQASRSMDTDDEGLSDPFEMYSFGTSITNRDTDGDGMTDYDEFVAATDPLNPIQCFETIGMYPIDPITGGLIIQWPSARNRWYSISSTTNLMIPFTFVVTNIPGTPPANTCTVIVSQAEQTFLRIEVHR
ncbi:MAG: polysaccharide biosynthesis protein, partial [Lentisphaerota bacterium]